MALKVLIVDDEALARSRLRTLLGECTEPRADVVGEASNAVQAMEQIQRNARKSDRFRWRSTDSHYIHPNGSQMFLRGVNEDRGESARGPHSHIIVNESSGAGRTRSTWWMRS